MAKRYYGSIDLTKLLEQAHKKHSGFTRQEKDGKQGHAYVSITIWENDAPDKYGNILAIQVNAVKNSGDENFYIGNLKQGSYVHGPLSESNLLDIPTDNDLAF